MYNFVEISQIKIHENRVRKGGPSEEKILEMLESIRGPNGLLQGPVGNREDSQWFITIGETRLRALERHWTSENPQPIKFGTTVIPPGTCPLRDLNSEDPADILRAQIDENVIRTDLSWQEKAEALAAYHLMAAENTPVMHTARKLANATGRDQSSVHKAIQRSLIVANGLNDPDVAKASSAREAFNIIKNKNVAALRQAAAEAKLPPVREELMEGVEDDEEPTPKAKPDIHTLLRGHCEPLMLDMPAGSFDMICADPPYGISADKWTFKSVTHRHRYGDDRDRALALYEFIAREGYRVCKSQANMFLFCSPDLWYDIKTIVENALGPDRPEEGWVVWPRPVVWIKGNEGMRPWGQMGFGYGWEAILYATKGEKGLIQTSMDYLEFYKPRARLHAAQKPDALIARLLELGGLPGDKVLDPTCGSGTIFRGATLANMTATGIEQDEHMQAIASHYLDGTLESDDGSEPSGNNRSEVDLSDF